MLTNSPMSDIPHLQLLVPGFCGPLPEISQLSSNKKICQIFSDLAMANAESIIHKDLHSLLADLFCIDTVPDFPSAALSLLGHITHDSSAWLAGENVAASDLKKNYFLHADPVHLRAEMDHAILVGTQDLDLATQDVKALVGMLQQHFSQDDVSVFSLDVQHWFIGVKKQQNLTTVPLAEAVGRNVNFILPEGEDSVYWRQFLNESQMLLYTHEVNQQREASGQLSVNSLWLYGGGALPDSRHRDGIDISSVCSDSFLASGIASLYELSLYSLPTQVAAYYQQIKSENKPLLYIDSLLPWLNYTDTDVWQQQIEKIYSLYLEPLLKIVRQGKLELTLHPCNGQSYTFKRKYHYRLYKYLSRQRAKPEDYVSTY